MRKLITTTASTLVLGLSLPVFSNISPENEIRIAVRAHAGEQQAFKKWQATVDYLNKSIKGYRFVMRPYTNLKQQLADAKQQKFDFVLTNPATYVALEINNNARALVTLINNRRDTPQTRFGSVIFTHVEHTDILGLQDLKDKAFIAVNPIGFGGWLVALKELRDQGIEPERDFTSLTFAGNQPGVIYAVRDKKAQAGVVRTDMLERLADKGEITLTEFRILNQQDTPNFPFFHSSALYPEWPFATMPHTQKRLAEQVKQALLKINPSDPAAKTGKYMGWSPALDYAPVRKLLKSLGIIPYEQTSKHAYINSWSIAGIVLIIGIVLYLYIYRRKQT